MHIYKELFGETKRTYSDAPICTDLATCCHTGVLSRFVLTHSSKIAAFHKICKDVVQNIYRTYI